MSVQCRVIQSGQCEYTQGYNPGVHYGIDIVNQNYTLGYIVAHSDGVVVKARNNCNASYNSNAEAIAVWGDGFGNYVMIDHENGFFTQYEHLAFGTVTVKVGDRVKKGQVIGYMGNTGHSRGGHLHFQVNKSQQWNDVVDPNPYLNADFVTIPQPVDRDVTKNQLQVVKEQVRVRTEPNTKATILGFAVDEGIYNHLDTAQNEGYTWYKIADNCWIANNGEWVKLLPKQDKDQKIKELEEEVIKLNNVIKDLNAKNKELLSENQTLSETNKQLVENNTNLTKLNEDLEKEKLVLVDNIEKYENEIDSLTITNDKLVDENNKLLKEIENLSNEYKVLFNIFGLYVCIKK